MFCQKIVFRGNLTFVFLFSEDQINLLKDVQPGQFFLDGFHKTPKDFDQSVTIFAFSHSHHGAFAIAHCLITGKSEDTYNIMFDEYLTLMDYYDCRDIFDQSIITTDFELALLNSIKTKFPECRQSGCFFHYVQCQMRNMKAHRLLEQSIRKNSYQLLTLINSLCFIDPQKIQSVFKTIMQKYNMNEYKEYLKYYEKNWINGYNIELWNYWNVYNDLKNSFKMTNNILESFHSLLLHLNNHSHQPSLTTFVSSLIYIESRQVNDFNKNDHEIFVKVIIFFNFCVRLIDLFYRKKVLWGPTI